MKPLFLFPIIYLLLIITSCTSPRYLDVQILNPAEVKLPQRIEKIFIVRNNLTYKINRISDSLYIIFLDNFYDKLRKTLPQSPLFTDCKFYVCNPDSFIKAFKESPYEVRKKYSLFRVDSLALADSLHVADSENPFIKLELKFSIVGRFSKFSSLDNFVSIRQKDTLFWEYIDSFEFKDDISVYGQGGSAIGEIFAQKMAPYWTTEERIFFHNYNKFMKKAYKAYLKNDISGAIAHWKRVYEVGTKHLASFASHNIAVCYEMLDDLDLCEEWLGKSIEARPNSITQNYLEEIKKRRGNVIKLNKQMLLP